MSLKVGDSLPSVDLYEGTPGGKVNIVDLFGEKKGIIFAVPGAFTPGCSKTHLPGYISEWDEIKNKGVEVVACVSVNDPFVMAAWGTQHGADGKIRMLADTNAEFTKAIGMSLNLPPLGGIRSKRYALLVNGGKVVAINEEPDGTGLTCSLASGIMAHL